MSTYLYQRPLSLSYRCMESMLALLQGKDYRSRQIKANRYPIPSDPIERSSLAKYLTANHVVNGFDVFYTQPVNPQNKIIFYLHGGAFCMGLLKLHYQFICKLLEHLQIRVVIPDYPLSPTHDFHDTYDMVERTYLQLREQYPNDEIIFMGDSVGGGLALSLYQGLKQQGYTLPDQMILLSPCVDVNANHPLIECYRQRDPLLREVEILRQVLYRYAKGQTYHPMVSPIYGDLGGISNLHIFIGTNDVLFPDCEVLIHKLNQAGSKADAYIYEDLCHCWMLVNQLRESKAAFEQIVQIIGD